jgi:hypothetical protein
MASDINYVAILPECELISGFLDFELRADCSDVDLTSQHSYLRLPHPRTGQLVCPT